MQAIVQQDDAEGRHVLAGFDYYWWEDGRWYGGDLFGLYDYLVRSGLVKFGRMIDGKAFDEIKKRVQNDPDFPAAPAWRMNEQARPT